MRQVDQTRTNAGDLAKLKEVAIRIREMRDICGFTVANDWSGRG